MDTLCPAIIQEFLTFLPARPWLDSETYPTSTDVYTAQDVAPAEDRPIYCHPDLTLILRLMEFLVGLVRSLDIGSVSCQSMQECLEAMSDVSFQAEVDMSRYSSHVTSAIRPIIQAIAEATGLPGRFSVEQQAVSEVQGDFDVTVVRKWLEDGRVLWEPVVVCSEEDRAYSVLLEKAEELSRPFSLDATEKQTGAKAMAVKLALQMVAAKAEYGFFFAGYIAIAAQLVRSPDPSRPGRILLLSPVFKLQNETLPYPNSLTHFQAKIPTEPFLAILVAMLLR
ncbi:uncharacterized protein EV420DRAFT_219994 [Desarmillaria tabescens]|uniref:Uncharacterized protein n=1 Tax=Armillaria tabescens TaxID=1929756 RepID=A0AA39N7T2_ARMTA|nr:uncharacterized protein EV420DRAFT_219994 [Desarmillaria tabescens]KAK0460615.1 hypothetical protein EV420DRAFT_219994 [Desarmillaria tabescens]